MPIRKFEMMHGAVLTKVCRSDRPIALSLIETSDDQRAAYWVNDALVLYVKHAGKPHHQDQRGKCRWQFTFTPDQILELSGLSRKSGVYLALVCAQKGFADPMEVCLLEPDEMAACLELDGPSQQWIAVEAEPGCSLRAFGAGNNRDREKIVVSRNRMDQWDVPGR